MQNAITFADLLRRTMGRKTLIEFAAEVGMSPSSISKWLNPHSGPPPIETIRTLAERLDLSPEDTLVWLRVSYPELPWAHEVSNEPVPSFLLNIWRQLTPARRAMLEEFGMYLIRRDDEYPDPIDPPL